MSSRVLIFDSGVGGLSIYREIYKLFPDLNYLYVFDNIAFPYGEKSEKCTIKRVVSIITAVTRVYQLSLVVIACNSASIVSLPALRSRFMFPIVGVVPAIKPAAQLTRNGVLGVLATQGTIRRSYTHELLSRFAGSCSITMLGSKELVELAESKLRGNVVPINIIKRILQPWLMMALPPDTVVLGCTHFPLIREELTNVLPEKTQLIDSGEAVARRIACLLGNTSYAVGPKTHNIALCMDSNQQALQLVPALNNYGFSRLEELTL
ncbi:Glutamate racemase [Candidatus Erwinia haradaeae]|uniref:Glutamate racemase n=1 Tax=Candidatus Erwinia haradaeae TaxID=1922217 RepID=A0A451DLE0_9GAMM|nr:glutamate racemase [Candidatus Erwinia haradaeae]VFP87559.1 Glutamate racemase [Candidatus Erwinia haradaeae]